MEITSQHTKPIDNDKTNYNKIENQNLLSTYIISCSEQKDYCIGMVDIINSTKISATMNYKDTVNYYQLFINSMSRIIERFRGIVMKNIGDCLLYYFPDSDKIDGDFGFTSCIECCLEMTDQHIQLEQEAKKLKLPKLDYRISVDYGRVTIMRSNKSEQIDLLGPSVNMCSKINHSAPTNQSVIGGDLYQMVKNFNDYNFKPAKDCSVGFKLDYPVYTVNRNKKR